MDSAILNISYARGAIHLLKQLYDFTVEGWDILLPKKHARVCFHNVTLPRNAHEANFNSPVSQYERPSAVALASSACVDKTTKIIIEFTRKDPFLHMKRAN